MSEPNKRCLSRRAWKHFKTIFISRMPWRLADSPPPNPPRLETPGLDRDDVKKGTSSYNIFALCGFGPPAIFFPMHVTSLEFHS